MCLLCIEFQQGKITIVEVRKTLIELTSDNNITNKDFWHFVKLDEADKLEEELRKYEQDDGTKKSIKSI